jgi:hypothetical protein
MTMEDRAVIAEIVKHVLASGDDDWVGLWELVWQVDRLMPSASNDEKRRLTLAGLQRVLDLGYANVGDLRSPVGWISPTQGPIPRQPLPHPTFEPWRGSQRDILTRIEAEWISAGRPPNIGDICWLLLTPEGEAASKMINDS